MKRLLVIGVVVAALLWLTRPAPAQDLSTDLALLLRGVIPRVAVTVDSATTFAITPRFPWAFIQLACTGAESVATITGGRQGTLLIIQDDDTDCTLTDDDSATATDAIDLTGSGDDTAAVGKIVVLIYNGSYWLEVTESDN